MLSNFTLIPMKEIETMSNFYRLSENVRQWSSKRGILDNSTAQAQLSKLQEELEETDQAVASQDESEIVDGLGDIAVCWLNACFLSGVDPEGALQHAWDEIKDRTGHLGADGKFYKDE